MSDDHDPSNIIDAEVVDNLPDVVRPSHEHSEPITKWSEQWWAAQPEHTQARRCHAHSSRTGKPCKNIALQGSAVCRFHGGAAKHVKAAARTRLENAAELMAKQLLGIALSADSEAVKLAAVKDALDRAGLKPPAEVVVSQGETKPYEEVFAGIGTFSRAESRRDRGLEDGADDWLSSTANSHDIETHWDPSAESGISAPPYGERCPAPSTGSPEFGPSGHNQPPIHITGDDAVRAANAANRAIGALPDQRAIESRHRRYPHP